MERKSIKSGYLYTIKHKKLKNYLFVGKLADTRRPSGYTLVGEVSGVQSELAVQEVLRVGSQLIITKEEKQEMSNEAEVEKMIQEKGLNAPRLTPQMIEDTIVEEIYTYPTGTLTHCTLVLVNKYTVTGESNCVSSENYNKEVGDKVARDNAKEEIWPLEGYLLKQKLYEDKGEG